MNNIFKLLHFIIPYWRRSVVALVLLTSLVFMDLSIPRLLQRIIDQGTHQQQFDKRVFFYRLYMSQFKGQQIKEIYYW
jgi:ABC-type multidrug transport system fused ATPase/permease subunit